MINRYQKPILLSETGHPKEHRPRWLKHIAEECEIALSRNIPLCAICWYPIIDRPNRDEIDNWHQSGFWDDDKSDLTLLKLRSPGAEAPAAAKGGLPWQN